MTMHMYHTMFLLGEVSFHVPRSRAAMVGILCSPVHQDDDVGLSCPGSGIQSQNGAVECSHLLVVQ